MELDHVRNIHKLILRIGTTESGPTELLQIFSVYFDYTIELLLINISLNAYLNWLLISVELHISVPVHMQNLI